MVHLSPLSVLPIRPLPTAVAAPPRTLSRIRKLEIDKGPVLRLPIPDTGSGQELAARLDRLAADGDRRRFFCLNDIGWEPLTVWLKALVGRPSDLHWSLRCRIDHSPSPPIVTPEIGRAVVQMEWLLPGPLPPLPFFKAFSNVGVWNHVIFEGQGANRHNCAAAMRAPNIIHSWEAGRRDTHACPLQNGYGRVPPLPGRPFWQAVTDPVLRFLLADRLTTDQMIRLRIDDDGDRIFRIAAHLDYRFVRPDELPEAYLDRICDMIAAGGTVAATHVRANLQRAFLIGCVEDNGVLVANSSLKNPRPAYIASVLRQSGLDLTGYLERGYTSVRPEYRGLGVGTRLLEGLTRRAGQRKIFSVISEDNTATQTIARRNRTRKVATYFSQKAGKPVGIWMPAGTIDR